MTTNESPGTELRVLPRAGLCALMVVGCAIPGLIISSSDFDFVGSLCGIACWFGICFRVISSERFQTAWRNPDFRKAVTVGASFKLVSVLAPWCWLPDVVVGLVITRFFTDTPLIGEGPLNVGFGITLVVTLLHGLPMSALLVTIIAILWAMFSNQPPPFDVRCPKCRYDLRASPVRCPECGEPNPASRQSTAG